MSKTYTVKVETLSAELAARLQKDILRLLAGYEKTSSDGAFVRAAQYAGNRVTLS